MTAPWRIVDLLLDSVRIGSDTRNRSHPEQVRAQLSVPAFLCPQIEWNEGEFIHERIGETVFREVDRLEVSAAGVATLDAYVGKTFGGVNR